MRILVTGASGFVGSHFCERLLTEGHEVMGIDNFVTGRRENVAHLQDGGRKFTLIEGDVCERIEVAGRLEAVLHLASPASPPAYLGLPIQTLRAGSWGTQKSLGVARAKSARFLLASTSEVYGDPLVNPQPESYWGNVNPVGPRGVYDEAKRFAEALTMAYHRVHGIDVKIARIFNTYGPRMRPDDGRVVSNFIRQALTGEPITVYGDGSQTRSFCYVDDLVEGLYRLLLSNHTGPMNVGNPAEMTVQELADMVLDLTESDAEVVRLPLPEDDPQVRRPDIALAREVLGWEPTVPLRTGLERTIAHFRGLLDPVRD